MKRAVLADTGPMYAAVDPDDEHHTRAQREIKQLTRDKREVILAYPTLLEAYTLVLYRLGQPAASMWLKDTLVGAALINPTPEDYREAATRLTDLADQPITLFDATLAVLATRLGIEVWTYDHHFDVMRTVVWRSGA
jgi:predicted nucleic acid-binding protein